MSNIQSYSPNTPVRPMSRTGRQVARVVGNSELAIVQVAGRAAIESAKLEAMQAIASQAMQGVAMVSQTEVQLAQMVPLATSRLQAIGDMHALASVEIVSSCPRRLG
jgi:hypothetical protein